MLLHVHSSSEHVTTAVDCNRPGEYSVLVECDRV